MSWFKAVKCFVKIMNSASVVLTMRQNFLASTSHCQVFQIREFISSKAVRPDHSGTKRIALDTAEGLDLSDYGSVLVPSFNFAAYADKSVLLQELIKLGVNLYEIEKKPDIDYILTLKWENIQKYLTFLKDNGVPYEKLGEFITVNPFIFKEDLVDLQIRINYLESKKFEKAMISNIIVRNQKWLSVPVKNIDERLGFLQESFQFTGDQTRHIVTTCPSLGTIEKKKLLVNMYTLKEELGLDKHAVKKLVLSQPKLLRRDPYDLISTYDYLTKTMNVPVELILKQAAVLTYRKFLLMERHLFLESLGRAQYNHLLPGYVPLLDLIESTDEEFSERIAKSSIKCLDTFLKTL